MRNRSPTITNGIEMLASRDISRRKKGERQRTYSSYRPMNQSHWHYIHILFVSLPGLSSPPKVISTAFLPPFSSTLLARPALPRLSVSLTLLISPISPISLTLFVSIEEELTCFVIAMGLLNSSAIEDGLLAIGLAKCMIFRLLIAHLFSISLSKSSTGIGLFRTSAQA